MKVLIKTEKELLAEGYHYIGKILVSPYGAFGGHDLVCLGKVVTLKGSIKHHRHVIYKGKDYFLPKNAMKTKKDIINAFFAENR